VKPLQILEPNFGVARLKYKSIQQVDSAMIQAYSPVIGHSFDVYPTSSVGLTSKSETAMQRSR
jgi:hypothetical protein